MYDIDSEDHDEGNTTLDFKISYDLVSLTTCFRRTDTHLITSRNR